MASMTNSASNLSCKIVISRQSRTMVFAKSLCSVLPFLLWSLFQACSATSSNPCPPSSCGNIPNITYPFRLQTDPPNCGHHGYTLYCSNNLTVLYLNSGAFLVQDINYHNFTIRLVDAGVQKDNCSSLPRSPLGTFIRFDSQTLYSRYSTTYMAFITCPNPVTSPLYVDTASCIHQDNSPSNSSLPLLKYTYVNVGSMSASDLLESCSIDMMTIVPDKDYENMSYAEIHSQMAYGFELSWYLIYCPKNCTTGCYVDELAEKVVCRENNSFVEYHEYYTKDRRFHVLYVMEVVWSYATYAGYYVAYKTHLLRLIEKTGLLRLFDKRVAVRTHLLWLFATPGWLVTLLAGIGFLLAEIALLRVAMFLLGAPCVFSFLIYKWRKRHLSMYDKVEEFLQNHHNLMPVRYSYSQIKKMTGGFKDKLGEGGFGCVYKAKLRSGRDAAIKMLGKSKAHGQDFVSEVATIGRIHHVNIVQLIGFCAEGSKQALVYDFMSNGSLDKHIFSREGCVSLNWEKLFHISLGVARGIEYLHQGCDMQILHFDIKPHNILLDETFTPKISDFGLAKLYLTKGSIASLTGVRGTIGYMAPELFYKNIGRVSYKADVYSFGMLLLEIAGKRKNLNAMVENSSQIYFPSWVYDQVSGENDIEIGDATEKETEVVKKMIIVGLWCIQMKPSDRPSMNKVVEMLEGDIENLDLPPKPTLVPEETSNKEGRELSSISDDSTGTISLIENAS